MSITNRHARVKQKVTDTGERPKSPALSEVPHNIHFYRQLTIISFDLSLY
jgi:hypothetical protein